MREQDWLKCEDPETMLNRLLHHVWVPFLVAKVPKPSDRKLRLIGVAMWWAWRNRCYIHDATALGKTHRESLEFIDGLLAKPTGDEWNLHIQSPGEFATGSLQHYTVAGIRPARFVTPAMRDAARERLPRPMAAEIIREIIGNPFRPSSVLKPAPWVCVDAARAIRVMAQDAYEGDWGVMPLIADALEYDGYADAAVLSHLRMPGQHYRGCWALDLILGKE